MQKSTLDKFTLDEEQLNSFHNFIEVFCSQPVLALPNRT